MTGPTEISLAMERSWVDYKPREKLDEVMPYQAVSRMIRHAFMSGYLAGFNDHPFCAWCAGPVGLYDELWDDLARIANHETCYSEVKAIAREAMSKMARPVRPAPERSGEDDAS